MSKWVKLSKAARRRADSLNLMIAVNPCGQDETEGCGAWDALVYVSGQVRHYAHGDLSEVVEQVTESVRSGLVTFSHEKGIK